MSSKNDTNNLFYIQFVIGLISIITTMEEVLMFSNILTTWSTYWAIILGNIKTKNRTKWSRILKRYIIWFKIRVYLPQQKTRGTIIILLIQSFLSCQSIHQFEIRTFNSPTQKQMQTSTCLLHQLLPMSLPQCIVFQLHKEGHRFLEVSQIFFQRRRLGQISDLQRPSLHYLQLVIHA